MTYARQRLYLGISGVGMTVALSLAAAWSSIFRTV